MDKINIFELQERLRGAGVISVPALQLAYGVTYPEAKELLSVVLEAEWVSPEPQGIRYTVIEANLHLRRMSNDEIARVADKPDMMDLALWRRLSHLKPYKMEMEDPKMVGRLQKLLHLGMISKTEKGYRKCVSDSAVREMRDTRL